jgi:chromate transport protein ChrA
MTPDFTLLLVSGMVFAVAVLGFVGWRFGGPDALALVSSLAVSQRSWISSLRL